MSKLPKPTLRWKKYFFPFFSAAFVMSIGALIFVLPPPLTTQYHETAVDQYRRVMITPEIAADLDKFSAISVTNSEPPNVELIRGNVFFDNNRMATRIQTIIINVGDVRLFEFGASFSLETLKNGARITITNGELDLHVGSQVHLITAGQQVDFDKQRIIKKSTIENLNVAPWRH